MGGDELVTVTLPFNPELDDHLVGPTILVVFDNVDNGSHVVLALVKGSGGALEDITDLGRGRVLVHDLVFFRRPYVSPPSY